MLRIGNKTAKDPGARQVLVPLEASFPLPVHIAMGSLQARISAHPLNLLCREEPRNDPGITPEAGSLGCPGPICGHPQIQPKNLGCTERAGSEN